MNTTGFAALAALAFGCAAAAPARPSVPDAVIDAAFAAANRDADLTLDNREARRLGIRSKVFAAADADKNGALDKVELAAAISLRFRKANPDGDGTLDLAEARAAGVKDQAAFDAADADHDGTLDLSEYLTALTQRASEAR